MAYRMICLLCNFLILTQLFLDIMQRVLGLHGELAATRALVLRIEVWGYALSLVIVRTGRPRVIWRAE